MTFSQPWAGIDDGILSEHQACVILHTLLSAGGESTSSLLGNAVRIFAEDQSLQTHLRRNQDLIPSFVEEALRLQSPFRFLLRSVPGPASLGGWNFLKAPLSSFSGELRIEIPSFLTKPIESYLIGQFPDAMLPSVEGSITAWGPH